MSADCTKISESSGLEVYICPKSIENKENKENEEKLSGVPVHFLPRFPRLPAVKYGHLYSYPYSYGYSYPQTYFYSYFPTYPQYPRFPQYPQFPDRPSHICPRNRPEICTKEYRPVCASKTVQCIRAPCPPIKQTYPNSCEACADPNVISWTYGSC